MKAATSPSSVSRSPTTSSPDLPPARLSAAAVAITCLVGGIAIVAVGCRGKAPRCEPGSAAEQAFEAELLMAVNRTRAAGAMCAGQRRGPVSPLVRAASLDCAARGHSRDMAARGFFDHENPDGEKPSDRARRAGHADRNVSENLAWGQATPAEVVKTWLASPGHCLTMMDGMSHSTGVGFATGAAGKTFWTQLYGR